MKTRTSIIYFLAIFIFVIGIPGILSIEAIHKGIFQYPSHYTDIAINNLQETYQAGQAFDISIDIVGIGYQGSELKILVRDQYGGSVWESEPWTPPFGIDYDGQYNIGFSPGSIGKPLVIDYPGRYTIVVSFENDILEREINIV